MTHSRRSLGAVLAIVGLLLATLGLVAGATAAQAAPATEGQVCNNQKDRADQDCVGGNAHGTVTTSYEADGDLVFDIVSSGTTEWTQFYLCLPSSGRTNSADCQGNTPTLIKPAGNYVVTTPAINTPEDKSVRFTATKTIQVVVDRAVFANLGTFSYTIHVNTTNGGTDEAFGDETPPAPGGSTPTYLCSSPTEVTATSATLRGATTDTSVTGATFTLTSGGSTVVDDADGAANGFSAQVTGLTAGTNYTYKVEFKTGAVVTGTANGCAFGTAAAPDTYECLAPSAITASGATLSARTSDGEIDVVNFTLSPSAGSVGAGTKTSSESAGNNVNSWSASATGLAASTTYTYTASFVDGAGPGSAESGVGSDPATCRFTTLAATTSTGGGAVDSGTTGGGGAPAAVAGAEADRGAVAPDATATPFVAVAGIQTAQPAVAAAPLARTGRDLGVLVPLGLALLLAGVLALFSTRRPVLVPAVVTATGRQPVVEAPTATGRPLLILAGLLLAGAVLPRAGGRYHR